MHAFQMITHPVRAGVLATIDDMYVLGVYPSRQDAQAACDAWTDMQEGRPVFSRYDDMGLMEMPISAPKIVYTPGGPLRVGLRNIGALDDAAQTGERVYIGTGEGFFGREGERVLTCSQVEDSSEHIAEDLLDRYWAACTEVDPRLISMLRV